MKGGYAVHMTEHFEQDFRGLAPEIQAAVLDCLEDFKRDPLPSGRRPHSVSARGNKPTVYTMDVTANKAYKLSFHLEGSKAVLRRVATHKKIDRVA